MKPYALLLVLAVSCVHVPAIGDACKDGVAYCANYDAAIACRDGKLAPFPCPGPKGCMVDSGRNVSCDASKGAKAATPCLPEYEGRGQCSAAETGVFLRCVKGDWVALPCPRGQICALDGPDMVCK